MGTTSTLSIPPLYCPIPSALNPNVDELNRDGLSWIARFMMFADRSAWDRYAAMNPGYLPGYVMPRAPRGKPLQVASNLLFWLWAYDDLECDEVVGRKSVDDHILQLSDLARVVETPDAPTPANPFLAALADLRRQVSEVASPVQVARWAASMQAYFMANVAAAIQRIQGVVPTLDTYVAQRIHSGAVKPTLMLLDVADGYEVPASELETPTVWALNEMVCTLVGWDNDLLTYHKEVMRGGADHNLVTVLAEAEGCSVTEAVSMAVRMREQVMALYLRLYDQVHATASPELRRYLGGLSSWIRGHLDWGMTTIRYRDPEAGSDLPDNLAARPEDVSPEPLPISSVAWWWDTLDTVHISSAAGVSR